MVNLEQIRQQDELHLPRHSLELIRKAGVHVGIGEEARVWKENARFPHLIAVLARDGHRQLEVVEHLQLNILEKVHMEPQR